MHNGYVKLLVNVIVLIAILVVMDVVAGWAGEKYMKWLNKEPRNSDAALVNYSLNAAKPDVAIIGSSTAICHYDPSIIHDSLYVWQGVDYDVFNMGISNQRLAYDYYGLKCLLDRTTPKIVIADVWPNYIGGRDSRSYSFYAFKPYANINPNVKEMLEKHGQWTVMTKSNMYNFNTEFVKLLLSVFRSTGGNGFVKKTVEMKEVVKDVTKDTTALQPLNVEEFDGLLALAKYRGVQLYVVMSPTLHSSDTTSLSYCYIKNRCAEEGVVFLDYSNDAKYYQPHFFFDKTHLNYYGAELFSQELMKDVKKFIIEEE